MACLTRIAVDFVRSCKVGNERYRFSIRNKLRKMFLSRELEDVKLPVVLQWHDIMWQVLDCFVLGHTLN